MTNSTCAAGKRVEPATLKGFRDYLPEDMIPRNRVIETIRKVYEKYGFQPIDTPILEYLATLTGAAGEETNKEIFRLESPEGDPIAMRFDLTVPFARLIAQYPEKIKLPFRRYHIGSVFRADKPGPGRFRQFTQFDIDAAGSESLAVDAEIVAAMCETLRALGLRSAATGAPEYQVRINNRKIVDVLLEGCGICDMETRKHVLRVIDKLQKVGEDNVRKELGEGRIDESGDPIRGVRLEARVIDKLLNFISIWGDSRGEVLEAIEKQLPDLETAKAVMKAMREFAQALNCLKVEETEALFDPTLTRGLDYYTGPVFEAFLPTAPEFGSIMGGGRYDQLVERFLETPIPATGVSIGIDRFMEALFALGKVELLPTTTKVILLAMKDVPTSELLKAAQEIRRHDISTEIYFGDPNTSMRNQLSYANSKAIPIAVIIGPDELESGKASIKDLVAGKKQRAGIEDRKQYVKAGKVGQVTVDRSELARTLLEMLGP